MARDSIHKPANPVLQTTISGQNRIGAFTDNREESVSQLSQQSMMNNYSNTVMQRSASFFSESSNMVRANSADHYSHSTIAAGHVAQLGRYEDLKKKSRRNKETRRTKIVKPRRGWLSPRGNYVLNDQRNHKKYLQRLNSRKEFDDQGTDFDTLLNNSTSQDYEDMLTRQTDHSVAMDESDNLPSLYQQLPGDQMFQEQDFQPGNTNEQEVGSFVWDQEKAEFVPEVQPQDRTEYIASLDSDEKNEHFDKVKRTLEQTVNESEDTLELESQFESLKSNLYLQDIYFDGLGTGSPMLKAKINPEFRIDISKLEMRGEPAGKNALKTKAQWKAKNLAVGSNTYVVGQEMLANPLGPDTMTGTNAGGNKDQKWIVNTPYGSKGRGSFIGGENRYIRGHLLNDNLGGPANQYNLFPITEDANHQHCNNAEELIKEGIRNGYLYSYHVEIKNDSVQDVPGHVGKLYSINCELHFHFGRLNAKKDIVDKTEHKGVIKSTFGDPNTKVAFWDEKKKKFEAKEKKDEYKDHKVGFGKKLPKGESVYDPLTMGDEDFDTANTGSLITPDKTHNASNYESKSFGTGSYIDAPKFKYPSSLTGTLPVTTTVTQTINTSADTSASISLRNSPDTKLINRYGAKGLVNGWLDNDIKQWQTNLISTKATRWVQVQAEAEKNKLDKKIAQTLFDDKGLGRKNTTVNGKG